MPGDRFPVQPLFGQRVSIFFFFAVRSLNDLVHSGHYSPPLKLNCRLSAQRCPNPELEGFQWVARNQRTQAGCW